MIKKQISEMQIFIHVLVLISFLSCTHKNPYLKQAIRLCHQNIIVDGHVDLPYRLKIKKFRLEKEFLGIPIKTKEGDFDFVRAKEGGLTAPFMSIYIPSALNPTQGKYLADSLINMINYIAANNKQYYQIATSPTEVEQIFKSGRIALPMGMENGSPLETIEDVKYFKKRGISYVTLTHAKVNQICDSSYDTIRKWNGLSPYGIEVVQELNKQGIMVDVSHISDSSFYDVMKVTQTPVIASHSSARKFTPGFERNMSDDLIKAMKPNEGIIMVNFGSDFLDSSVATTNKANQKNIETLLKAKNFTVESNEGKKLIKNYKKQNPTIYSDVERVADHIDHIVSLIGIDHVGLGSDYDGVGDSLPRGLKDVSDYPNLVAVLLQRNYTEEEIAKICYKNLFRVWKTVIKFSANGNR
jgi:membrane dipeptidase